ncbi:MAG: TrkH family potassium uptake protein [Desulfotomaculales bacterium]
MQEEEASFLSIRKKSSSLFSPAKTLVAGFAFVILSGALFLCLPFASATGRPADFLTALFTATSAVCVTGLAVVDTGTYWSFWGQLIIMLLIQTGGLGFMTMATLFFLILGKKIGLKERILIRESLNQEDVAGVVRLVRGVLLFTFLTEGFFALVLSVRWYYDFGWPRCLWQGVFHAVSAFNNAGFDLFGDFRSLTAYVDDPVVVLSVSALIVLGGLGFSVVLNLFRWRRERLSLHSRLVLWVTSLLLGGAFFCFLFLEWTNALKDLSLSGKILASLFQSVTPRTAGFNTVDIASLRPATQFFLIILMFIGASPGSTGGGIKTTTFGLLVLAAWSLARGAEETCVMRRRIPAGQVYKAIAVALLALFLVTVSVLVLNITERADFLSILFETVSAFGTVGLSMGLTPHLSASGRILIIMTMFCGRLGPLTLAFALARRKKKFPVRYPEERILIG